MPCGCACVHGDGYECIEMGIGNMRESAWSSCLCELTQGAQKEGHKGASEGILRIIPGVTLSRKQNDILHFGWLPGPAGPWPSHSGAYPPPSKLKGTGIASSRSLGGKGRALSTFWGLEAGREESQEAGAPPQEDAGGYYTRTRPVSIAQGETGVG